MGKELIKVPVGDWSDDGHGKTMIFHITANYPIEHMQQAYKDTCKKIGLQMHDGYNTNYTELEEVNKHGNWRKLFVDYLSRAITREAYDILKAHGFNKTGSIDEDEEGYAYFYPHDVFNLFMWFVSYSMPDDFKYEEVTINAKPLVGYWCKGLNESIGYGVFD